MCTLHYPPHRHIVITTLQARASYCTIHKMLGARDGTSCTNPITILCCCARYILHYSQIIQTIIFIVYPTYIELSIGSRLSRNVMEWKLNVRGTSVARLNHENLNYSTDMKTHHINSNLLSGGIKLMVRVEIKSRPTARTGRTGNRPVEQRHPHHHEFVICLGVFKVIVFDVLGPCLTLKASKLAIV